MGNRSLVISISWEQIWILILNASYARALENVWISSEQVFDIHRTLIHIEILEAYKFWVNIYQYILALNIWNIWPTSLIGLKIHQTSLRFNYKFFILIFKRDKNIFLNILTFSLNKTQNPSNSFHRLTY